MNVGGMKYQGERMRRYGVRALVSEVYLGELQVNTEEDFEDKRALV